MRLWAFLSAMVRRVAFGVATTSTLLLSSGDASPTYPTINSMAALAKFAWVRTCVWAVAGDAAGLPLVAVREVPGNGKRGQKRELVQDAGLDLLKNPSPGVSESLLRKQLLVDYLPGGNAYLWVLGRSTAVRVHPERVTPQGTPYVTESFKIYDPGTGDYQIVPPYTRERGSGIVWFRDASWANTSGPALGAAAVESIHDDLMIEWGSRKLAASQAAKGKPDMMFSIPGMEGMGDGAKERIKGEWKRATTAGDGLLIIGGSVTATPLSWNPDAYKFTERSDTTRDLILGVFEVPPARAGLSSANYGTQKQQMRTYWESVARRVAVFDDGFSQLAAPGVRIVHDFTDVEALQVSYTERLQRVGNWISYGMTPAAAAAYEGFDDAELPDTVPDTFRKPTNIDQRPEEPQGDKALALTAYLSEAMGRYVEMAAAAADGVDVSLLLRWETGLLLSLIDRGMQSATAQAWAAEIAATTLEGARIAGEDAEALDRLFSAERAQRVADSMRRRVAA